MRLLFLLCTAAMLMSCGGAKKSTTFSRQVIETKPEENKGEAVQTKTISSTTQGAGSKPEENKVEYVTSLQVKYANIVGVQPNEFNSNLASFIEEWRGVPYFWGGEDKLGIDCSALMQKLYKRVYAIELPRNSYQQYKAPVVSVYSGKEFIKTGDLIFFKTKEGDPVTHVGIYLANEYFLNSNYSVGVNIDKLTDIYWSQKIVAYGRVVGM